jgi:hypothetical protein
MSSLLQIVADDNESLRLFAEKESHTIKALWQDNISLSTRVSTLELIGDQITLLDS